MPGYRKDLIGVFLKNVEFIQVYTFNRNSHITMFTHVCDLGVNVFGFYVNIDQRMQKKNCFEIVCRICVLFSALKMILKTAHISWRMK